MSLDLPALLRFARDLQRATVVGELLVAVHQAVREATGYGNVWLAAIEPGAPRLVRILGSSGDIEQALWERAPLFAVDGDAMLEEIVAADRPVVVDDARTDPRTDKAMVARLGNRTIVNVPLLIGDERLGALGAGTFHPEPPRPPTAEALEVLTVYASLLAGAFQRLQLVAGQRTLQRRLQATQRLESLGVLAGGIAHDFNNLLTVIVHGAGFVREGALTAAQRADLDALVDAAERGGQLTRQMLAMGRKSPLSLTPQDLGASVVKTQAMLRRAFPENIAVKLDLPPALPPVVADPQLLGQVLMNLCLNARDAMPGGGALTLAAHVTGWSAEALAPHPGVQPGRFVCLSVSDTGSGMAPEVLEHVLEPFFTTKPSGTGTGLGLAVVSGIVEQHRGFLECASAPGRGTTFRVHLPVFEGEEGAPQAARGAAAEPPLRVRPVEAGRLLLAEDDPAVRNVALRVLEAAGYLVTAVADGRAAIESAAAQDFELVILDGAMPGASGREALSRIRAARPETRFLIISGHLAEIFLAEPMEGAGVAFLPKPFKAVELLRAVRAAIEGPLD